MDAFVLVVIVLMFVGSLFSAIYSCRRFLIADHRARQNKSVPDMSGMWLLATFLFSLSTIAGLCGMILASIILLA